MTVNAGRATTDLTVCPDIGAAITLADKKFVQQIFPTAVWEQLHEPVRYAGAGPGKMMTTEIAYLTLFVPSHTKSGEQVYALWRVCAYIVEHLGPNLLLGMDTLAPQNVIIDIKNRCME